MKNPIYSICMCNFNMQETIIPSITSIADQINHKFEIIIVDDGSTDKSIEKLELLKLKYSFIKIIKLKKSKNRRLGLTRNISIQKSSGKYVLLHLDCDDIYEKHIIDFINVFHFIEKNTKNDFLLKGMQVNMAKKDFLLNHGPYRNLFYTEDRDLWVRMASLNKLIILDHKTFCRRIPLKKKRKFYKTLIYSSIIIKQNFETGSNFFSCIKSEIFSENSLSLKIYKIIISLPMFLLAKISNYRLETMNYYVFSYKEWNFYREKNNISLLAFCNQKNLNKNNIDLSNDGKKIFF